MTETLQTPPRSRYSAVVLNHRKVCREHYLLTLRPVQPKIFPPTQPGQFIQLACGPVDFAAVEDHAVEFGPGTPKPDWLEADLQEPMPFLRRPYSIAGRREGPQGTEIDVLYRVSGLGTGWLERLKPGQTADFIGPLGNEFALTPEKSIGLLVGGGVGLPPMFYLAERLWENGWSGCAFIGAMTGDLLPITPTESAPSEEGHPALCCQEFMRCGMPAVITTDDGTRGLKGRVTDGLRLYLREMDAESRQITVVYVCGPNPMMSAVGKLAAEFGVEAQACLEQPMACGMSTCQSCVVKVRGLRPHEVAHGHDAAGTPWRYRLACTDGPVFNTSSILW